MTQLEFRRTIKALWPYVNITISHGNRLTIAGDKPGDQHQINILATAAGLRTDSTRRGFLKEIPS